MFCRASIPHGGGKRNKPIREGISGPSSSILIISGEEAKAPLRIEAREEATKSGAPSAGQAGVGTACMYGKKASKGGNGVKRVTHRHFGQKYTI